jgi:hypothetical protein
MDHRRALSFVCDELIVSDESQAAKVINMTIASNLPNALEIQRKLEGITSPLGMRIGEATVALGNCV